MKKIGTVNICQRKDLLSIARGSLIKYMKLKENFFIIIKTISILIIFAIFIVYVVSPIVRFFNDMTQSVEKCLEQSEECIEKLR